MQEDRPPPAAPGLLPGPPPDRGPARRSTGAGRPTACSSSPDRPLGCTGRIDRARVDSSTARSTRCLSLSLMTGSVTAATHPGVEANPAAPGSPWRAGRSGRRGPRRIRPSARCAGARSPPQDRAGRLPRRRAPARAEPRGCGPERAAAAFCSAPAAKYSTPADAVAACSPNRSARPSRSGGSPSPIRARATSACARFVAVYAQIDGVTLDQRQHHAASQSRSASRRFSTGSPRRRST